jgi:hypothetical protein
MAERKPVDKHPAEQEKDRAGSSGYGHRPYRQRIPGELQDQPRQRDQKELVPQEATRTARPRAGGSHGS